uniref:Uncharacterized protein n=1 Tax=Anopheles culicifacies TaxID=139723 RepID=A0A182M2Y2_9DIPT
MLSSSRNEKPNRMRRGKINRYSRILVAQYATVSSQTQRIIFTGRRIFWDHLASPFFFCGVFFRRFLTVLVLPRSISLPIVVLILMVFDASNTNSIGSIRGHVGQACSGPAAPTKPQTRASCMVIVQQS